MSKSVQCNCTFGIGTWKGCMSGLTHSSTKGKWNLTPAWARRYRTCSKTGIDLTLFLRQEGAPLDNNICERALKKSILHRKTARTLYFTRLEMEPVSAICAAATGSDSRTDRRQVGIFPKAKSIAFLACDGKRRKCSAPTSMPALPQTTNKPSGLRCAARRGWALAEEVAGGGTPPRN